MNRNGFGCVRISLLALLVVFLSAGAGSAQVVAGTGPAAKPAARSSAGPASGPEAPQTVSFGSDGVTLEDAVRMTLAHNPSLKLAESAMSRQQGVAQQQSGLFDLTLKIKASFEDRFQELTESRKEEQRKKRQDVQDMVTTTRAAASQTTRLQQLLQEASLLPPGAEQVAAITQLSAATGTELKVLDTLIANTPEPGRSEIVKARQSLIAETLAGLQPQMANYNKLVADAEANLTNWGTPPVDEFTRNGKFDLQLAKYLRSGLMIAPYFNGVVDSTSFVAKPISADFGGKGVEDLWTFKAGVNFALPLWRGRGATAFAAGERAARAEAAASRLTYEHQASASALGTIRAYWDLRAAQDSLAAAQHSVEVAARVAEVTNSLIRAEELPRMELARAQAGEARARSRFSDAQRRVRDARVALVKAIGVTVADGDGALPRAKDAFPVVPPAPALQGAAATTLVTESLGRRRDVGASQKLDEAGRILEAGAKRNRSPRLDLTAGTWMTALGERTVSRVIDQWVGPSVSVGVEFEKPFGNNTLRGQAVQRSAEARQRQISVADLARQVRLDVLRVAAAVSETAERVQQAELAVTLFRQTVDAEIDRFKVGETTLIDTLQSEQQLTDALLTLASAQRDLAQLVAELRFQTGTLVAGMAVAGPALITLPSGTGR